MTDLVAFLLQRVAEDEELIQGNFEGEKWHVWFSSAEAWIPPGGDPELPFSCGLRVEYDDDSEDEVMMRTWYDMLAIHVARWDPARVLAECAAKRVIIAGHQRGSQFPDWDDEPGEPRFRCTCNEWRAWPCRDLKALAVPFAAHPDFDPAWETP